MSHDPVIRRLIGYVQYYLSVGRTEAAIRDQIAESETMPSHTPAQVAEAFGEAVSNLEVAQILRERSQDAPMREAFLTEQGAPDILGVRVGARVRDAAGHEHRVSVTVNAASYYSIQDVLETAKAYILAGRLDSRGKHSHATELIGDVWLDAVVEDGLEGAAETI